MTNVREQLEALFENSDYRMKQSECQKEYEFFMTHKEPMYEENNYDEQ